MSNTSGTSATQATRMQHEYNTSNTSATRATRMRHEYDISNTSATRTIRVQHECCTSNTSATRVKNFDLDNDTSKNIFSQPYIYYVAIERLQGEEQYHCKN